MSYFSECAKHIGSNSFLIPYNRQQLADYLNVDRSTMCNELSERFGKIYRQASDWDMGEEGSDLQQEQAANRDNIKKGNLNNFFSAPQSCCNIWAEVI